MGFFNNLFKNSDTATLNMAEVGTATDPNTGSGVVKSTNPSQTQTSVNEDTAMSVACLNQGITIIGDTIASMPVYLYQNVNGFQQVFPLDARSLALSRMANDAYSAFNLKKSMIKDLILYGVAYAQIVSVSNTECQLNYIPPQIVMAHWDSTGYFFQVQGYTTNVLGENVQSQIIDYADMIVVTRNAKYNTILGQGLLTYGKDILSLSMEETQYMNNLFKNGLSAKAVLSSKTPFKREIKEQLKSDLQEFYSGSSNAGKMLVLEGDISVDSLALSPTDIDLINTENFTISEIARFLNIPKHMLNLDRQQGTYSNITQERLQLLQNTLTSYTVAFEEAFNQKLLTPQEIQQGYYFQFDTSQMLKLTPQDQAQYMLSLFEANVVTLEEVREALNLGGDEDTVQELQKLQQLKSQQIATQMKTNISQEQVAQQQATGGKLVNDDEIVDEASPQATK